MNDDTMPAGPEMDRLVAEKVMGWRMRPHPLGPLKHMYQCWLEGDAPVCTIHEFEPSTNIAHAWEVIDRLPLVIGDGTERAEFTIARCDDGSWSAGYEAGYGIGWTHHANAPTAPLAICRAALKAVFPQEAP